MLYAQEWGLDATFEPYVAEPLAAFAKAGASAGRIWIARRQSEFMGSLAVVRAQPGVGQIRWVLLRPEARGTGLARDLLREALAWSRTEGLGKLYLWTFDDLVAARRLYERFGFVETERKAARTWGRDLTEVRMDLALAGP